MLHLQSATRESDDTSPGHEAGTLVFQRVIGSMGASLLSDHFVRPSELSEEENNGSEGADNTATTLTE